MALAFHIQIDKDMVRRILARHYRPGQDSDGPSWLTFFGHRLEKPWVANQGVLKSKELTL
jgi:putative transposase